MEKLTKLLETIVFALVDDTDAVQIESKIDEQGVLFTVKVSGRDVGKVIGRKGSIAEAIRVVLRSAGFTHDIRASMKVDAHNSTFNPYDVDAILDK